MAHCDNCAKLAAEIERLTRINAEHCRTIAQYVKMNATLEAERDSLHAQLEQMSRPATTGECSRFRDNYGDSTLSLYWIDGALNAILAARAAKGDKGC